MMRIKENGKSKLIPSRTEIESVSICEKYKYIRSHLTPKLYWSERTILTYKRKADVVGKTLPIFEG